MSEWRPTQSLGHIPKKGVYKEETSFLADAVTSEGVVAKRNSRVLSLRANYTDRATAAYQRS
jgi:hypothetical protein